MRKVIEGHRYDSDTARVVGTWDNRLDRSDLYWVQETLYRTRAWLYFVHGEGGARTQYSRQDGIGGWTGGESVTPLPADDARMWAERHLTGEECEAEWGTPDEGEGRVMSVRVPEATYQAIRRAAADTSRTMGEVVTDAVMR